MKSHISNSVIFKVSILCFYLLLMCCKKNASNGLIVFDVTKSYPVKTLNIEDVADVEYLILDISDDNYLFSEFSSMTDNYIICRARNVIFFFDRSTGKPVSRIDRRGNGPGEYISCSLPVYDEQKNELFIIDSREIKVYGMDGVFKRKFACNYDHFLPFAMSNFDENYLLLSGVGVFGGMSENVGLRKDLQMMDTASFMLISKRDGLTDVIPIPFEKRIPVMYSRNNVVMGPLNLCFAVRNGQDFLLTEYSSDTVYRMTMQRQLIPVLVRKPSIQNMNTKIFLHSWLETGMYLFFSMELLDYDWDAMKWPPEKGYLMEKKSGQFFQTNVQMRDYKGKKLIIGPSVIYRTPNPQTGIIVWSSLELQDANKENRLSGKLKEVTNRLKEIDEYVFMILKFKER